MSLGRRRAWAWACVALLALPHRTAGAEAASTPPIAPRHGETPDSGREQARAQFREGLTLLDAGEYARALTCFQRAHALWQNPKIVLNIATAQRALNQLAKAANNYALYQRAGEPEPARAEEVARILATLDAGLGQLLFSNVDARQRFWLNEEELTVEANQPIRIEPGEYTLRIVKPGAPADTRPVAVWPGELLRVDAEPSRPAKSVKVAPATPEPESRRPSLEPPRAFRVRALARVDVDVQRRGALGAVGAAVALTDFLRGTGGALLGVNQGFWLGLELLPSRHWVAPMLGISAPFFFVEGVRTGVSAELGLRVEVAPRVAPFARASVTHFPSVPTGYVQTLVVPAIGVEVGL